ncbi:protein NUCLEAR FUSION DEFECTIVE 6, mitochondrial-like [Lolium rigidum]|uniref:protein NUCLEAR FUSION DEFECTIVE 6, mitochondrial-like n=1 Tax=Lolium rigidum TaxID=89674 RepID=UPI001F5DE266|nr:protein NUCLEAR FUSION DEFECTIVE 6, mitochondrial-like [Lolium rigidum]
MATAAGGARRALAGLRSASPSTLSRAISRPAVAQSPGAAAASALPRAASRRRLAISRVPVAALGGVQGLMPLHSATASALLTSMLGLKPGSWGWLSEGFATPL